MPQLPRLFLGLLLAAASQAAPAQTIVNPLTGPFPQVTGEMLVEVPTTPSCTVTLVRDHAFWNTEYGPDKAYDGMYAPDARCTGPWSRVVLTLTGRVSGGTQYDRMGEVAIGGATVLDLSTPEGRGEGDTLWQVQRDITEYAKLLTAPQPVHFQIGNVVTGPYTGVFYGTLTLTFYKTDAATPAGRQADLVKPIGNHRTYLWSPEQKLTDHVVFPQNLLRLEADMYTTGHGAGEEDWWYAPFISAGRPYREVGIEIDGRLAGVAPVFPILFTGGWGPDNWWPIPAPRAFNMRPYRVDLTPFVGLLTDGAPHEVSVRILNWDAASPGHWPTSAVLLGYVNPKTGARTKGGLLGYDVPADPVWNDINHDGLTSYAGTGQRRLKISGWAQPANGVATHTTVEAQIDVAPEVIGAAIASDWSWTTKVTTQTEGQPEVVESNDAVYRLVRTGASWDITDGYDWTLTRGGSKVDGRSMFDHMVTSGPAMVTGYVQTSEEQWKYSRFNGACVDHRLATAAMSILVDEVRNDTCGLPSP